MSNLVDNALLYTPRGGHVDVRALKSQAGIVLEVSDDGPGIPPSEHERVFDRFYRLAGNEAPGSGLGLAIVRSIVERHGATIDLDLGLSGQGLLVRVTFFAPVLGKDTP
jgi:two-component system, OmpR family, sensor kinase